MSRNLLTTGSGSADCAWPGTTGVEHFFHICFLPDYFESASFTRHCGSAALAK